MGGGGIMARAGRQQQRGLRRRRVVVGHDGPNWHGYAGRTQRAQRPAAPPCRAWRWKGNGHVGRGRDDL